MQRDYFIEKGARECAARGKLEIAHEKMGQAGRDMTAKGLLPLP